MATLRSRSLVAGELRTHLLEGGGHFFPEEDPAGTAALLLDFLDARD
jgi:pimeloyl-ACP methyl ester carboxylesterase